MKKCLIVPDSFKGTLSATEICEIEKAAVKRHFPKCEVVTIPIADGGEGTVDCFLYALDAEKVVVDTTGPYGEPIQAYYARIGGKAILEMASVAGLPFVERIGRLNPAKTTTYGLGALIHHAVEAGCREIVIGLGGSCTNDGGVGMARALGTVFYDEKDEPFAPASDELIRISRIDNSRTEELLDGVRITGMCDIDNPMYGETGAAYVFAPQKGADAEMVKLLDQNLRALAEAIDQSLGKDVSGLPGAGAAGALGAGIVAFLGGHLRSGIDTVLNLVEYEKLLAGADMVFTGEGRIDAQSLRGKVVIGVAKRAVATGVPVTAVVGSIGDGAEGAYDLGVSAICSINRQAQDFEQSRYSSKENLEKTMEDLLRFYKCSGEQKEKQV